MPIAKPWSPIAFWLKPDSYLAKHVINVLKVSPANKSLLDAREAITCGLIVKIGDIALKYKVGGSGGNSGARANTGKNITPKRKIKIVSRCL